MGRARSSSLQRTGALILLPLWLANCPAPPSYRVVSLEQARQLLEQPGVALLDAVGVQAQPLPPLPRGIRWDVRSGALAPPDDLPAGAVLVVASDERTGHRSAAALARGDHRPVYVYIPRSAEDRIGLHAHAPEPGEHSGGRDS